MSKGNRLRGGGRRTSPIRGTRAADSKAIQGSTVFDEKQGYNRQQRRHPTYTVDEDGNRKRESPTTVAYRYERQQPNSKGPADYE